MNFQILNYNKNIILKLLKIKVKKNKKGIRKRAERRLDDILLYH